MNRFLLVLLLTAAGCGRTLLAVDGGAPDAGPTVDAGPEFDGGCVATSFTNACDAVKGAVFASLSKGECGLCPMGSDCTCTWHVTFSGADRWSWQHSDYGQAGTYSCSGFKLTGSGGLVDYLGSYDPVCDRLTWDGVVYVRER